MPDRGPGNAFIAIADAGRDRHAKAGKSELWLGTANWHGGFCHAPPPPQRGTSPSPREVFDRTTFPPPLWIPAFAGMTNGGRYDRPGCLGLRLHTTPRITIFVPMAHAGSSRHTTV